MRIERARCSADGTAHDATRAEGREATPLGLARTGMTPADLSGVSRHRTRFSHPERAVPSLRVIQEP